MFDATPYYLVLLIAAIPALIGRKRKASIGWAYFFIFLLFFVGLRYQVGGDWWGYLQIADSLRDKKFFELFQQEEVGFNFLVWTSVHLGFDIYGANVVTTALFLYGLFEYCKKQINPWLAIFTALPFLVIVIGMSANRQAAAIGVTLLVLAGWNKSNLRNKIILISFAMMFHTSAIIFALFVLVDSHISKVKKAILGIFLFLTITLFLGGSESVTRYKTSYIGGTDINVAAGALLQIILNALPALIFLIMSRRNSFRKIIPHWNIIFVMSILSIILIPISLVYSVAASRISFYLFPVSIAFLTALPEAFPTSSKRLIKFLVVCYGFLVLGLWLNFANTAFAHIPYKNILTNSL